MRTVNPKPVLSGVAVVLGMTLLVAASATRADVVSDQAAGLVIFPKLVFSSDQGIDTEIQLSNTSDKQVYVRCFYVNANSHCTNLPQAVCNTNEDCVFSGRPNGTCRAGWQESDFRFELTARQPILWRVSDGLVQFPLDGSRVSRFGTFNKDSLIIPAPEDPFIGELKCFQVQDGSGEELPLDVLNDLKAEVTIVEASERALDARGYNAIGVKQKAENEAGANTLVLATNGTYNGCPDILILDHFFDDAIVFADEENANTAWVRSHITFVPCSQDFLFQTTFETKLQFLVYNEFEQRYSTSTGVDCFKEVPLSDIDTRPRPFRDWLATSTGDPFSIFNINVQGTLTGQTRIRPVDDGSQVHGNGVVAVAEEFHRTDFLDLRSLRASAAYQVDLFGERDDPDFIRVPSPQLP